MSEAIAVAIGLLGRQIEANHAAAQQRIDRFEDNVTKRLDAQDAQLKDVCDKGQKDHARFDDQYAELRGRIDAREAEARGRAQIIAPVVGFVREHGLLLAVVGLGAWTATDDLWPALQAASQPAPMAAAQVFADPIRPRATAAIPHKEDGLHGRLEAWQDPRP